MKRKNDLYLFQIRRLEDDLEGDKKKAGELEVKVKVCKLLWIDQKKIRKN